MNTLEVKCLCGETKLRIGAEPVAQLYCHCGDCRAAHGAAYVASSIYPAASIEVIGHAPVARVVKRTQRMHCRSCGTHLFSEIASVNMRSVNAFLLPPGRFKAQLHIQCQDAVLPVVDSLPHYKGFPSAFGGKEEFVSW
jgi:hypothetical protein